MELKVIERNEERKKIVRAISGLDLKDLESHIRDLT